MGVRLVGLLMEKRLSNTQQEELVKNLAVYEAELCSVKFEGGIGSLRKDSNGKYVVGPLIPPLGKWDKSFLGPWSSVVEFIKPPAMYAINRLECDPEVGRKIKVNFQRANQLSNRNS
jgi:hypothetical protein